MQEPSPAQIDAFIGASRMRDALGDGYTESLRKAGKGDIPESADFVMFWWCKAAAEVVQGRCKQFGFITTNFIHQTFNRRVIEPFVAAVSNRQAPLHLAYAIPDHPWVDSADGAAVRIAMTIAAPGKAEGILEKVITEQAREDGENEVTLLRSGGLIAPNLQIGADLSSCTPLQANATLAHRGVQTIGAGFIISPDEVKSLGLGADTAIEKHIRGDQNGRDLTDKPRGVRVIDLYGLTADEALTQWPSLYQHVLIHVKPERDHNNRDSYRKNWWIHGKPRRDLRPALADLPRYIATVETSKHRFFTFLDQEILPDKKLIAIAADDAFVLGVLSSSVHVTWALAAGSWLGVGNDSVYVKSRCFDTFPFPALEEGSLKQRIRDLGERLDSHRKRQQKQHPGLTLTGMYNVLEKLRSGEPLTAKEKLIHDQDLVTVLRQIHDELDAAVLEAYGWSDLSERDTGIPACSSAPGASPEEAGRNAYITSLLTRLVALNHARAAEEKRGLIRWLRPDYQNPNSSTRDGHRPPLQDDLAAHFGKRTKPRIQQISEILDTLSALGKL
jgi:hypothetical protein